MAYPSILDKSDKEFADFYEELLEEVKDRIAQGASPPSPLRGAVS